MREKESPPEAMRYAAEATALRELAERGKFSSELREQLLRVAVLYDRLAEQVENAAFHTLTVAALVATKDLPKENQDHTAVKMLSIRPDDPEDG
jgi:hypothetical protein